MIGCGQRAKGRRETTARVVGTCEADATFPSLVGGACLVSWGMNYLRYHIPDKRIRVQTIVRLSSDHETVV